MTENLFDKVKACPFCGSRGRIEYEENEFPSKDKWVKVQCVSCGGNSGWYLSEEMAIEAWNKREQ